MQPEKQSQLAAHKLHLIMNASGSVQRTIMINRTLKSAITCENVFHNTEHKSLKINRTQNVFI